jgi:hypothetical protein
MGGPNAQRSDITDVNITKRGEQFGEVHSVYQPLTDHQEDSAVKYKKYNQDLAVLL